MGSYIIKYEGVRKNPDGSIAEVLVSADLESGCGNPVDGRKVRGTIHWLSAKHAATAGVMLYDKLFTVPNLGDIPEDKDFTEYINPNSLVKVTGAKIEPALLDAEPEEKFQFVRIGYFCKDTKYPNTFNRIVTLKEGYKF